MAGEIKRLNAMNVSRSTHITGDAHFYDVRTALTLLEQADAVMHMVEIGDTSPCPLCSAAPDKPHNDRCAIGTWRERYKLAKGK